MISQLFDSIKKAAFVLGTASLVVVAARNTITWHLQRFWGASGDFWQSLWDLSYDKIFDRNELLMGILGTFLVSFFVFWVANVFLLFLDVTGRPAGLLRYKVQADKNSPVNLNDLMRAVKQVLFNQTVVGFPFIALSFLLMRWRGCSVSGELPTFHWVLFELLIFTLVEEIGFYYSHRLFHHPRLYKYIHKRHHEWTAPIGIISIYAHPVEHILSNMVPPLLGPVLMGAHLGSTWLWITLALWSTTVAHSGYHFPFFPSPEAHDFHHLKFNQNYGVLGVLDRLHGTDNQFRNSTAYQRHFMLLSLVPVSQQFPDPPKKKAC